MSADLKSAATDLVRWSFSINPAHRVAIESQLSDLGADVLVREGQDFVVTWDEPDDDLSGVIEAIWSLNGEPFDVIQEEFRRLELLTIQQAEDEPGQAAA